MRVVVVLLMAVALAVVGVTVEAHPMQDTTLELNEIVWHPEKPQIYIGSPTLVRLSNGNILAGADRFGSGFTGQPRNVSVFLSEDNGTSWNQVAWVTNQYWSNLFQVDTQTTPPAPVYLLGTSSDANGGIKISASFDGGRTWPSTTMLFNATEKGYYATGATPTLLASNGRIYRAIELDVPPYAWGRDFAAVVVSADANADLLNASSWSITPPLPFNRSWVPPSWPTLDKPGYLEGNMVEGPDGTLYNILRFNVEPNVLGNYAVALRYNPHSNTLKFDRIFELPGGHTKFTIRRDARTGVYLALTNPNTNVKYTDQRNVLVLSASEDLFNWTVVTTLLQDDTGFPEDDSVRYTGFHYVDWQFDGTASDDIIYVIRTAYRGAVSYHNSNRMTFKRIVDWRTVVFAASDITVSNARMQASFSRDVHTYTVDIPAASTTIGVAVTSDFSNITINGQPAESRHPVQVAGVKNGTTIVIRVGTTTYTLHAVVPSLPQQPAAAHITGTDFRIRPFVEGATAFSDRTYVWRNVPYELQHLNFTQLPGGASDVTMNAHVRSGGLAIIATHLNIQSLLVQGWERQAKWDFYYTDSTNSTMQVVSKHMSAGEDITVPQDGWAGRVLICTED
ncbi:hypothetical protein PTSG_00825 [Salpingoeca rosetta]|uniref:Cadherin-like beta-sandwich-like domain-containing protein n=1 Tax=Salpingoeca rosetta (strain ATCC 50818 / BSB-021) TaxID=946362 RepID=F2TXK8_SALR5|nr:uncharacterized protein PTSG_00825 [Salpingoeca rosetta]EGD76117.1 hypothetical protein PTSG_00825 [Salpingoeca rosetta]|eukprot:XP_004998292.1 hypothetical protein PTSG_00825 [Salpingoeca rosetta]